MSHVVSNAVKLSIVVPCYNECDVLQETNKRLVLQLELMSKEGLVAPSSIIYYIDDGSSDGTWSLIENIASLDNRVRGIKLSRNCGHQVALMSGLLTVDGDAVISMDADLQDDPEVIPEMVREYQAGADIVYGVRGSRATDSPFKRWSASAYYRTMKRLGVDLVYNHADFRLISRRVLDALRGYKEVNLFLRGIIPLIGFKSSIVRYDRNFRFAGATKYPIRRMLAFASEGITSFSIVPLRVITIGGLIVSAFSFIMIIYILFKKLTFGDVVPGWASSVVPIYFIGGLQLLSIGILGEYIGKTYLETKARPRFFIDKVTPKIR